jgi:hypothetical protein
MTAIPAENPSPGVMLRTFPIFPPEEVRHRARERQRLCRKRRQVVRSGGCCCEVHVTGTTLYSLRRMGLLADSDTGPAAVAEAVAHFLRITTSEVANIVAWFRSADDEVTF